MTAKKRYIKPVASRDRLEQALTEVNEKLWQANHRLEEEERSRQELLANLSHDLRAPLTALAGAVELLQSGEELDEEAYRNLLNLMGRRVKTMQSMMDELFLLSQVESPGTALQPERIQAGLFLEEYFFSCAADERYKHRELKLEVPEDFPYFIDVDVNKMIRVLDNLFTNALRYSGDGARIVLGAKAGKGAAEDRDEIPAGAGSGRKAGEGIEEGIGAEAGREAGADVSSVCIYVRDSGEGISEEDLPHIFERSYRADRSRTPEKSGSGLGLAIVKSIVERHGGRVRCESRSGEGSCFLITLPCSCPNA